MNVGRFFRSTSSRTFIVIPLLLLLLEWFLQGEHLQLQPLGLPLLLWGYLQYKLAGHYRTRLGGGGPGFKRPPEHSPHGTSRMNWRYCSRAASDSASL